MKWKIKNLFVNLFCHPDKNEPWLKISYQSSEQINVQWQRHYNNWRSEQDVFNKIQSELIAW